MFLDPTIIEYAPGEFFVGIFTLGEEDAYQWVTYQVCYRAARSAKS